jgi:hypothetical protein
LHRLSHRRLVQRGVGKPANLGCTVDTIGDALPEHFEP